MSLVVAPLEALTDPRLTDPERRVLLALFSFRGKDTNTVFPGIDALAKRSHLNDKTRVSKLTKSLAEKGWLTKKKRGFTGGNEYRLKVPEWEKASNLDQVAKLGGDANSNLDSETNSNLDSAAKCKEQTSEQTNEQGGENSPQPKPSVGKPKIPPCPYQTLVDLYHETLPQLPDCRVLNDERKGLIRSRWKEKHNLDWWRNYFEWVGSSLFLTGQCEPRPGKPPFVADLEWIVRPRNYAHIVEGKYHRGQRF